MYARFLTLLEPQSRFGDKLLKHLSALSPKRDCGSKGVKGQSTLWGAETPVLILRGTIVNRTYGIQQNLYIQPFLRTIFGPTNYGPP